MKTKVLASTKMERMLARGAIVDPRRVKRLYQAILAVCPITYKCHDAIARLARSKSRARQHARYAQRFVARNGGYYVK